MMAVILFPLNMPLICWKIKMNAEIPGIDSEDEIGMMAKAVLVFQENMIKAEQKEEQAQRGKRCAKIEE